jgi:surfactin synthase thioesterase subunit
VGRQVVLRLSIPGWVDHRAVPVGGPIARVAGVALRRMASEPRGWSGEYDLLAAPVFLRGHGFGTVEEFEAACRLAGVKAERVDDACRGRKEGA